MHILMSWKVDVILETSITLAFSGRQHTADYASDALYIHTD